MLKSFQLTLLVGPVIAVPAPRSVIEALVSAQITTAAGRRSGFQLVFAPSKGSELTRVLLPAGYFDPGVRVILIATMGGVPTVLMDGAITRQDVTAGNQPGSGTLTVTGEDISLMMDLVDWSGQLPYPAMPAAARVAMIIAKYAMYGLIPLVIPEIFPNVTIPIDKIATHQGTDLGYIQKLASDNGYVFYVEPGPAPGANVAYFGPEIRVGAPQPALSVNMDANSNVESLSFGFDGTAPTRYAVMIQEPNTKLGIPIPIPEISLLRPPLALKQAPTLKFEKLDSVAKLKPAEAISFGLGKASASSDAVNGSGQLDVMRYGSVLKARQLVGVRGAGVSYDGLYYVKSVTHSIKRGEYKQSFALARNGLISLTPRVPV